MKHALVALLLCPGLVLAQAPQLLGYQGRLVKTDGTPESGNAQMRFGLFGTETGGSAVWEETQAVAISQGYYSTYLGRVTTFPAALFDTGALWLEVSVQAPGDTQFRTMTPRQRVGSVAFALSARNLKGGTVDATGISINGTTVIDSSGRLTTSAGYTAGPGISIDGTTRAISVNSSGCSTGQVLQWNGSAWQCSTVGGGSAGISSVTGTGAITVMNGSTAPVVSVRVGIDAGTVAAGDDARFGNATALQGVAVLGTPPITGDVLRFSSNAWASAPAVPTNTAGAVVARDSNGNFSAGTITATLAGNSTNVTGVVAVANGGTGATNAAAARANLGLGTISTVNLNGNSGTVVRGDGSLGSVPAPAFQLCNVTPAENSSNKPCLIPLYRCPSVGNDCAGHLSTSPTCVSGSIVGVVACTLVARTLLF